MDAARGIRNNNPLNIRRGSAWKGRRSSVTDRDFEEFESMTYGCRAALKLIRNYISGNNAAKVKFNTIEKLVSRWAPEIENATKNYIQFVSDVTHIPASRQLYADNKQELCAIAQAMAQMEVGSVIPLVIFQTAWDLM